MRQITGLSSARHALSPAGRGRRHSLRFFLGSDGESEHRVPDLKVVRLSLISRRATK